MSEQGAFGDMAEASDFVAEAMTFGARPQFSANETAKAFARAGRPRKPQKIVPACGGVLC